MSNAPLTALFIHLYTLGDMLQEAQASVLQCVLRLLPDLHPEEAQEDVLIGALLFSSLPFKEPFSHDADTSQVRAGSMSRGRFKLLT